MNSQNALLYRILRLFPVSVIKANFNTENKVQNPMLHEIVNAVSRETILDFVINNIGFTKQHVFLFNNPMGLTAARGHNFQPVNLYFSLSEEEVTTDYYIFEQAYELVVSSKRDNLITRMSLNFLQPMVIEINPHYIAFKLTILERSPSSYLDDYDVLKFNRTLEDEQVVELLINHFRSTFGNNFHCLDVNRGIKHLWRNDSIDALSIKYKRESSMATEVMDENFTFKQQYPARFEEVMLSPLRKHAFRFLNNQDNYCDFVIDPTEGISSFNKYPTQINQINNVITEILRNN